MDNTATGLTRLSRELPYLTANPAYARMVGVPLDDIVGALDGGRLGPRGG